MCGGSWSLLDEFNAKKPVIVSDIGFFSEIPNEAVVKIPIDKQERDILEAQLLSLISDHKKRVAIGKYGYEYSQKNYNEEQYLKDFEQSLAQIKSDNQMGLLTKTAEEIGSFTDTLLNESEVFEIIESMSNRR